MPWRHTCFFNTYLAVVGYPTRDGLDRRADGRQDRPVTVHDDNPARDLVAHIGSTLRQQRDRHRLTQAELAERAAVKQSTVARIERGDRGASVAMLARLFASLGSRVRLTVEPLDIEVDEAIGALAGKPISERIAEAGIAAFAEELAPIPYVFVGATAALLQGAPVPVRMMEVALARPDCDAFIGWLGRHYGARWHDQYQEYGYAPLDPRLPGERRWRIVGNAVIRVELADELPESLEVRHGRHVYRVLPLTEVEIADSFAARLLRRYRDHAGFR
jgi:transcriptional regulator with XRE-family HTH domain